MKNLEKGERIEICSVGGLKIIQTKTSILLLQILCSLQILLNSKEMTKRLKLAEAVALFQFCCQQKLSAKTLRWWNCKKRNGQIFVKEYSAQQFV